MSAAPSVLVATMLLAASAAATTLVRGPYLQLLTTHSVTVVWNTDLPATCALAIGPVGDPPTVIPGSVATVCAIAVDGLDPGAEYAYTPVADGVALEAASIFQTDDPARPFIFMVVGDSGSRDAAQLAVRDRMLTTPADFILSTGDMIYESGLATEFDPAFFTPYRDLIRRVVFWPTLGNHDVRTLSGQPWRDAFYTPANNLAGSENYYSFDFGNAHVAVLDSNASTSPGSAQYVFLDADLGASPAVWKFVAFHHTIYSSAGPPLGTGHGSDLAIRSNLTPLFDSHGVDVVFMGHDHTYERTLPLRAEQVVAPGAGTVYVTTGGGGRSLRAAFQSSFTAYSESVFHVTRVSIAGDVLLTEMIRADGSIGDALTLVKGAATTTTTQATSTTTSSTTTTFSGSVTAVDLRVATSSDDAEEAASGSVSLVSSDLELVDDAGLQTVGMRFAGVPVPPGAVILAAHIQFQVDEVTSVATALRIEGEANANAATFTTTARNVSVRPRTVAAVAWSPPAWPTVDAAGTSQRTPGLATVIQEIVSQPGWASGNALAIIITGTGKRVAEAYNGVPGAAPLLHIEYTSGVATTTTATTTTTSSTTEPSTTSTSETTTSVTTTSSTSTTTETTTTTTTEASTTSSVTSTTSETTSTATSSSSTSTSSTSISSPTSTSTSSTSPSTLITIASTSTTAPLPTTATTTTSTTLPTILTTIELRVAANSDDAEEAPSRAVSLGSSDLELVDDGGLQVVGLRFTGVAVPRGATIAAAWVQFKVDEVTSAATSLRIEGQASDNAATFTAASGNVSTRLRTPAVVTWSPAAWPTVGAVGTAQWTPSLTTVIQAIVSRPGWSSGNVLALLITGTGKRVARAREGEPAGAALLHVEYGAAGSVSTTSTTSTTTTTIAPGGTTTVEVRVAASSGDVEESASRSVNLTSSDLELVAEASNQTVGMRFAGLAVPQGATIVEAYVQFQVDETSTAATSLTIQGEDTDNALAFSSSVGNVSSRQRTAASVPWSPAGWSVVGAAGADQRTPDLGAVLQAIIVRPGWASGQAVVIVVTGTGKRVARAYDGTPSGAPLLRVTYRTAAP